MKRIAVIPGDGVGQEVSREAVKVLKTVNERFELKLAVEELDYGAERYLRDGVGLPPGEIARFAAEVDAIFLGALGDPRIPDMRHGREILLALRFELDLYINLRPVVCLDDRLCPLRHKTATDIDFVVLRENTEGIYVGMGGNFKKGTADEVAINEDVNTRKGVERIIRAAFAQAQRKGRKKVTMADKSNAMGYAHGLWRRVFDIVSAEYPDITAQHLYVDALVMEMVRAPEQFDVIVTNNLFGDIVTDLGASLQGGMGMAASANINPQGISLFEPVHGSAPPLAGKDVANPIAAVLTAGLMLEHLGYGEAAHTVERAVRLAVKNNQLTSDVGGTLGTQAAGDVLAEAIAKGV